MRHFVGLFLFVVICQVVAEDVMCYFCSDTSSLSDRNRCQTWVRTMNYFRKNLLKTNKFETGKYVKNCTGYGNNGQAFYNKKSFIRDCSDGTEFFGEQMNQYFVTCYVLPDNQTTCKVTSQDPTACVSICNPAVHGNVCNGQVFVSSSTQCVPNIMMMLTFLCVGFIKCCYIAKRSFSDMCLM